MTRSAVVRVLAAGLLASVALCTEADAQVPDGNFVGTIQCDALPALRALRTRMTMSVAAGRARYEREIQQPGGGPTGTFERGEGPVTPSGEITVATRAAAPGYSYEAEYRGRIDEGAARLTGTQRWKLQRESGTIVRACSLELMRVAQ